MSVRYFFREPSNDSRYVSQGWILEGGRSSLFLECRFNEEGSWDPRQLNLEDLQEVHMNVSPRRGGLVRTMVINRTYDGANPEGIRLTPGTCWGGLHMPTRHVPATPKEKGPLLGIVTSLIDQELKALSPLTRPDQPFYWQGEGRSSVLIGDYLLRTVRDLTDKGNLQPNYPHEFAHLRELGLLN